MLLDFNKVSSCCRWAVVLVLMQACTVKTLPSDQTATEKPQQIAQLSQAVRTLGSAVDPVEAQRAASIAIEYSQQLAREYEVASSPLMHNLLVNIGLKSRGLCVHWTRDLITRLRQEKFRSLDFHWGIANYEFAFRIEHSTTIVSARGDPLSQGLVLDPWRQSGRLFWAPTRHDPEYHWRPQAEIHALKRAAKAGNQR